MGDPCGLIHSMAVLKNFCTGHIPATTLPARAAIEARQCIKVDATTAPPKQTAARPSAMARAVRSSFSLEDDCCMTAKPHRQHLVPTIERLAQARGQPPRGLGRTNLRTRSLVAAGRPPRFVGEYATSLTRGNAYAQSAPCRSRRRLRGDDRMTHCRFDQGIAVLFRWTRLACTIQSGSGMPSRCRPPATAPAQAATAPSSNAVAAENAKMTVLARVRKIAFFESAMTVSTRRSASAPVKPVRAVTC